MVVLTRGVRSPPWDHLRRRRTQRFHIGGGAKMGGPFHRCNRQGRLGCGIGTSDMSGEATMFVRIGVHWSFAK